MSKERITKEETIKILNNLSKALEKDLTFPYEVLKQRVLVDNNDVLLCDFAENAEKYLLDVVEDDSSWEISEESAEQLIREADGEVLAEIRKYL